MLSLRFALSVLPSADAINHIKPFVSLSIKTAAALTDRSGFVPPGVV